MSESTQGIVTKDLLEPTCRFQDPTLDLEKAVADYKMAAAHPDPKHPFKVSRAAALAGECAARYYKTSTIGGTSTALRESTLWFDRADKNLGRQANREASEREKVAICIGRVSAYNSIVGYTGIPLSEGLSIIRCHLNTASQIFKNQHGSRPTWGLYATALYQHTAVLEALHGNHGRALIASIKGAWRGIQSLMSENYLGEDSKLVRQHVVANLLAGATAVSGWLERTIPGAARFRNWGLSKLIH